MPSTTITALHAREVLDSRGNPTVAVRATTQAGATAEAMVPSGASTGSHEALELRDNNPRRYAGKGVLKAVRNVNNTLRKAILGHDGRDQIKIDQRMLALDGTINKSRLGANAILGVSLAVAQVTAKTLKRPLYKHLRLSFPYTYTGWKLPIPMMNILNGGVHADNGLCIQEFMIVPQRNRFSERIRLGAEVFHALHQILKDQGLASGVGDEGGFAPALKKNSQAIELIALAVKKAGYKFGTDIKFAMDSAASEFHKNGAYYFDEKKLSAYQVVQIYQRWAKKYPILSIEDGLAEDDWEGWSMMTSEIGDDMLLVGDDLFVTNKARLQVGIDKAVANSILIKVNQIGTLTETMDTIQAARQANYTVVISHRSGETEDTTISDLAVAVNAEYIKTGSLSRSERISKYNRLLAIEQELV